MGVTHEEKQGVHIDGLCDIVSTCEVEYRIKKIYMKEIHHIIYYDKGTMSSNSMR